MSSCVIEAISEGVSCPLASAAASRGAMSRSRSLTRRLSPSFSIFGALKEGLSVRGSASSKTPSKVGAWRVRSPRPQRAFGTPYQFRSVARMDVES